MDDVASAACYKGGSVIARIVTCALFVTLVVQSLATARPLMICLHTGAITSPCPCPDGATAADEATIADAGCCRLLPATAGPVIPALWSQPADGGVLLARAVENSAEPILFPPTALAAPEQHEPPPSRTYARIQHLLI